MTVRFPSTDPEKNHCRFGLICIISLHTLAQDIFVGCFVLFFFPSNLALYCKYTQYSKIYTASVNIAKMPVTVLSRLSLCVTVCGKGQHYNNISATQW